MPRCRITITTIVVVVCVLVFLGSGFLLFLELREYRQSKESYEELSNFVAPKQETPKEPTTETLTPSYQMDSAPPTVTEKRTALMDFELLLERAPDAVAWLMQEDTAINYPVVQGEDNDYYLHHLYDGTANGAGCLFVDYQNSPDFSDKNSIVYGHNMQDGSMFASLKNYREQEYYDEHPIMLLITPEQAFFVEIFAAFTAVPTEHGTGSSPWITGWTEDVAYAEWLEEMLKRSVIECDVIPEASDKVLTLSTCAPGSSNRFIVMGRLTEYE